MESKLPGKVTVNVGQEDAPPNVWLNERFPHLRQYGQAFYGSWELAGDYRRIFVPEYLNDDFFAGVIGGEERLGHKIVFYAPDKTFLFFDPRTDCFHSTSVGKMELILSNYILRAATSTPYVELAKVMGEFRNQRTLHRIIERAKRVHDVGPEFFATGTGRRMIRDGQIVYSDAIAPLHEAYLTEKIVLDPEGALTTKNLYFGYERYCQRNTLAPLERPMFTQFATKSFRSRGIKMRHDVPDENGKSQAGWFGLRESM